MGHCQNFERVRWAACIFRFSFHETPKTDKGAPAAPKRRERGRLKRYFRNSLIFLRVGGGWRVGGGFSN